MLKKIYVGLLFVSFSAFGAAGSSLVPFVAPEGASPIEILQKGFSEMGTLPHRVYSKKWKDCLDACERSLDKAIERKEYDQLMAVAKFCCDDSADGLHWAYSIMEKCIVNYPDTDILFLLSPKGRTVLEEAVKWTLRTFDVAGLKTVCSRILPEDFTRALQMFEPLYSYDGHLWAPIMCSASFTDMELSNDLNVKQVFDVVKKMKERVCGWYRHVGLKETELVLEPLEMIYEKIIDAFDTLSDEEKHFDPAVLLQVYQAGIEGKEIAESNRKIILKALTVFKKIGIHPSNLFRSDKPEVESLFSAGLTYANTNFLVPLNKQCSLLSPEEFDVEAARLQRLDSFRWWYVKHRDRLYSGSMGFVDQYPYFEKLERAGHNALLQHQTLFTLLAPMLGASHV